MAGHADGPAPRDVRIAASATLVITIVTIVMGAVVRATHSGDGCGPNWPTCEGTLVLPGSGDTAQLIEFSHRAISGVALIAVLVMAAMVFRLVVAGHPARRAAAWSVALMAVEALIGALIVLYGWVADDRSLARQVSVPLHLVNTFLLTAALAYTVWLVQGHAVPRWRAAPRLTRALLGLSLVLLLIAATGATTALADTVFAAEEALGSADPDFAAEAAMIVRLRVLHPIVAIAGGVLILVFVWRRLDDLEARGHAWAGRVLVVGIVLQAFLGFSHIVLGTPLITALAHLLLAQVLWISLVWVALTILAPARVGGPA
ncbi:MAG: COX15/CtaA family protein, partial [Chloroflexi bacterium]|nr:COX15/CtaA family protein [Chloroflexota bacterium]